MVCFLSYSRTQEETTYQIPVKELGLTRGYIGHGGAHWNSAHMEKGCLSGLLLCERIRCTKTCKLVICQSCHIMHSMVWNAEKKIERRKWAKKNGGESVAKLTGVQDKGASMHHTRADLKDMVMMADIKYCT